MTLAATLPRKNAARVGSVRSTIERLAFGGAGICRLPTGKVCFVQGVVPGESVEIRVVREKKNYAEGVLLSVVEPSPHRVKPVCPVFGTCGGCQYQHLDYPLQLKVKRAHVEDALTRIGRVPEPCVEETVPSPEVYGYRNRITVHTRRGVTGFFARDSRSIVGIGHCAIAKEEVNTQLAELLDSNPKDGEHFLREASEFRGFRQVNAGAAESLLGLVEEAVRPGGRLLIDAFCGAGFFGHRLAPLFGDVIGIEWSLDAVRHARAKRSGNEIYLSGDVAEHFLPALAAAPADETTVLVDPPAEGLPDAVVEALSERMPHRLVYVSCDPTTLARDISGLLGTMRLVKACPIDMFPQTAHVECVTVLEKK